MRAGLGWIWWGWRGELAVAKPPADSTRKYRDERGRLLPGNPAAWKPGTTGNPNGRASTEKEVAKAARALSLEGISTLAEVMRNARAPAMAKVRAVEVLLERAYGKAPQRVFLAGEAAAMDNPQLQNFLQSALVEAARTIDGSVVEDS